MGDTYLKSLNSKLQIKLVTSAHMFIISVLFVLSISWLVLSLAALFLVKKTFRQYKNFPKINVPDHCQGFKRQDFGKWNEAVIIKGCFLRLPPKAIILFTYILGFSFLCLLKKYLHLPSICVNLWRNYIGRLANIAVFQLQQHFKIDEKITTPMVIANHLSWFDFNYMGSCFRLFSFIAKKDVQKIFALNAIADFGQCLYVDRTANSGRGNIFEQIKNRIIEFQNCKDGSVSPMLIFPEGTVSNGRVVMSFKNGAFQNLPPITMFSLRYECKQFHMGMDEVNAFYYTVIALCLTPKLIVKRQTISPKAGESVQEYRQRCRQILAEMGNFKISNCSYRDIVQYQKLVAEARQKLKSNLD